jgi:hypothetical protein
VASTTTKNVVSRASIGSVNGMNLINLYYFLVTAEGAQYHPRGREPFISQAGAEQAHQPAGEVL